jgi:hypothetical protein
MRAISIGNKADRWSWSVAGDGIMAPPAAPSPAKNNSVQQLIFEIGLAIAVPLALAALFSILVGD